MYSLEEIRHFRTKYGKRGLLLDTNILLLYLVGTYEREYINDCQLTTKYTCDDFDLLKKLLKYFDSQILITPHILTELSNLSRLRIKAPKFHNYFFLVINKLKNFKEEHAPLNDLLGVEIKIIHSYGFPDMSLVEVSKRTKSVILTDELPLAKFAYEAKIPAINFTHIKSRELLNL